MLAGLDSTITISGMKVMSHSETAGLGAKIKEDSFELSNNKTMTTAHTDAHPNIANSVQSYSDEDDFDEFLDEMTEQY